MKLKFIFFHGILTNDAIYKAAIDIAREKNNAEIVKLLSNGPNESNKLFIERIKKLHLRNISKIHEKILQMKKAREITKQLDNYKYLDTVVNTVNNIMNQT